MNFLDKLSKRFKPLLEDEAEQKFTESSDWKDPWSKGYDRQYAEDCLYHTVGPLTDNPRWDNKPWSSSSEPPAGFAPGGPAPKWDQTEVTIAMAGDPSKKRGSSRSKEYGNMGGAPIWRLANKIHAMYGKKVDIDDLYNNGLLGLAKLMQPGYDQSRSAFIPFAMTRLKYDIMHGTGRTQAEVDANKVVTDLLEMNIVPGDMSDADRIEEIATGIGEKYRQESSHDKSRDNPYGKFSPQIYKITMDLASAIRTEDDDMVQDVKRRLQELNDEIDSHVGILSASTGLGQAITTKDRATSVGIRSIDQPASGQDETAKMAQNIKDTGVAAPDESLINREVITYVLKKSLQDNIADIVGKVPKLQRVVQRVVQTRKANETDVAQAFKPVTMTGYRYLLRQLGKEMSQGYYGEGVLRSALSVPREAKGWCTAGEDPEIDKAPDNTMWESEWRRDRRPLTSRQIAEEMAREVVDLQNRGIATARASKLKMVDGAPFVMSPQSVDMTIRPIQLKLAMLAALYEVSDVDYFEEQKLDSTDRTILAEACLVLEQHLERMHNKGVISEMFRRR